MKTTTYKLTMKGVKGTAYAMFNDEVLHILINELEETPVHLQRDRFFAMMQGFGITHQELHPKTVADKVAMFCMLHKKYKGFAYRAGKTEKANMRGVNVNEQLLDAYFTNATYPLTTTKTMADYVRHFNTVTDISRNGKPTKKTNFPDIYDREYERTISDDVSKLQSYWSHLREIGFRKVEGVWIKQ